MTIPPLASVAAVPGVWADGPQEPPPLPGECAIAPTHGKGTKSPPWIAALIVGGIVALVGLIVLVVLLGSVGGPLDAASLYAECAAHPEAAAGKYLNKRVQLRGTVARTVVTHFNVTVYLHTGRQDRRRLDDRLAAVFAFGEAGDMGFDWQFSPSGKVILPWRDGERITISGICKLGTTSCFRGMTRKETEPEFPAEEMAIQLVHPKLE